MVKIRVDEEGEAEDSALYNIPEEDVDNSCDEEENTTDVNIGQMNSSGTLGRNHSRSIDRKEDYKFVQKRWKDLYDVGDAVMLQDAVKSHLYNNNYENDRELDMSDIDPEFNPLDF